MFASNVRILWLKLLLVHSGRCLGAEVVGCHDDRRIELILEGGLVKVPLARRRLILRVKWRIIFYLLLLGSGWLLDTVLWYHEDRFAIHHRLFVILHNCSLFFETIVCAEDGFVHGQARDRGWIAAVLEVLPIVLLGGVAHLRQLDGLLKLPFLFTDSLRLTDLFLLLDSLVFLAEVEGPLGVQSQVHGEVQTGHVLTRAEHARVADTSEDFVGNFEVGTGSRWKHVVLHPVQMNVQRTAVLKIVGHEEPILFLVRVAHFLQ